eukprot:4283752-Pyramimonas_sp.AAC.1
MAATTATRRGENPTRHRHSPPDRELHPRRAHAQAAADCAAGCAALRATGRTAGCTVGCAARGRATEIEPWAV